MIRFFRFKVVWWYDYDEDNALDDQTSQGIVAAESYDDALSKIIRRFQHIVEVTLFEYEDDTDFIFLDNKTYNFVLENFDIWNLEDDADLTAAE